MDSLHLASGQTCPPIIPGSLRIYSMRFCPYAQRALLAAAAKGIIYDVVNINLMSKPEFLLSKYPEGKVPTVETSDGKVLYESLIVCDFIDEAFNTPGQGGGDTPPRFLHPQDPYKKAVDRIWVERFSKISSLDYQLYFPTNLDSERIQELMNEMNVQLGVFEEELKLRGTKFFGGFEKPGMLDYMIWPWVERFPSLQLIHEKQSTTLEEGRARLPTLVRWEAAMKEDEAVKQSYLSPEIHAKYRKMRRTGGPVNYDFLHSTESREDDKQA